MNYIYHILILVSIYSLIAISLNLISGYTGMVSVAHAAFYGIGAYTTGILATKFGSHILPELLAAILVASAFGAVIAIPSLKIHEDHFVIATFSFQVIVFGLLNNLVFLTGGPLGIAGIPKPIIFGVILTSHLRFLFFSAIIAILGFLFVKRLAESPFGRVLKAIREDEIYAMAIGKNIRKYKIMIFIAVKIVLKLKEN